MKKLLLTVLLSVTAGNLCAMNSNESNNNNNANNNNNNNEDAIALIQARFNAWRSPSGARITEAPLEDLPYTSQIRSLLHLQDLPAAQDILFSEEVSRGASSSSSSRFQIHVDHRRPAYVRTNQETSRSLIDIPSTTFTHTTQDQETTALELGSDPHRYPSTPFALAQDYDMTSGAIAIDAAQLTQQDRNDARTFAQTINNAPSYRSPSHFQDHPKDRIKIAKAVMCC